MSLKGHVPRLYQINPTPALTFVYSKEKKYFETVF